MKNFALIGVAGYIAPRHLKAIKETGNQLVAALDRSDSVGVLDGFFPESDFFTEFERFDRHIEKLRRMNSHRSVDYVVIASPNYLHDAHIRFALRTQSHAICEKPLVLNPWNVDALKEIEAESGKTVYSILQLRLHPVIQDLKARISQSRPGTRHAIDLTYITARGRWYGYSWKGDPSKSGGIATNIGIHFFDMLTWVFGGIGENIVHLHEPDRAAGFMELEKARVRWYLSLRAEDLPEESWRIGRRSHRSLTVDGQTLDFDDGFANLHTDSYREILSGGGFRMDDCLPSIEAVYKIRLGRIETNRGERHPFLETGRA